MKSVAFLLFLAFMCSWFLHVPARYPALGAIRVDLVLLGVIVLLIAITRDDTTRDDLANQSTYLLVLLFVYAIVTLPFVEWPGSVLRAGLPQFVKAAVFFFFTASLATSPRKLKWLLIVFLACETFRVFEPLYLHVTDGYWGDTASMADWERLDRLSGAPLDVINPNGLAFIVLTIVPFLHYVTAGSFFGRGIYLMTLPGLLYALILTGSRSGLVGLAAIGALIWIQSRHKVAMAVVFMALVAVTLPRLPDDLADRYLSIFSSDTRNAATAEGRLRAWGSDFSVAMRRPLFGHGLGTSREANANFANTDKPSHNLYTEILQEIGACGFVIFVWWIYVLLRGLWRVRKQIGGAADLPPLVERLVPALQVWIGMNILFSFASYGLSGYEWYMTGGLVQVVVRLATQADTRQAPAVAAVQPFGPVFSPWAAQSRP